MEVDLFFVGLFINTERKELLCCFINFGWNSLIWKSIQQQRHPVWMLSTLRWTQMVCDLICVTITRFLLIVHLSNSTNSSFWNTKWLFYIRTRILQWPFNKNWIVCRVYGHWIYIYEYQLLKWNGTSTWQLTGRSLFALVQILP